MVSETRSTINSIDKQHETLDHSQPTISPLLPSFSGLQTHSGSQSGVNYAAFKKKASNYI